MEQEQATRNADPRPGYRLALPLPDPATYDKRVFWVDELPLDRYPHETPAGAFCYIRVVGVRTRRYWKVIRWDAQAGSFATYWEDFDTALEAGHMMPGG